ncbi:MAG: DUF5063 domain-containing protein [Bacteroidales bacterium]|nr:DUF5063 domain-containing protein [Bacteroidales bacterium]
MENIHDFVYSPEVLDFVKVSKDFVDLLESDLPEERKVFTQRILQILPDLYAKMISLPPNEPEDDSGNQKHVTEEEWSSVYQKIYGNLASQNEYLDIPEDTEYDRLEIISRELSEDLSDIFQDIKDFLENFRVGNEDVMNNAIWDCMVNFENYWGTKLLRASLNLHKSYTRDVEILEKMDSVFMEKHGGKEIDTNEWFISKRQQEGEGN